MVKEDCPICCESTTQLQFITCNFCNFKGCKTCTQRYLLDITSDPHCMSCKNGWSREFIDITFTKKFVNNDLKKHREHVLLDREKAMLPATQAACEREKLVRQTRCEINQLLVERRRLQNELYALNDAIRNQENNVYRIRHNFSTQTTERKQFVRKCPSENCRGFLSTQWKCGTCDAHVCKYCNETP